MGCHFLLQGIFLAQGSNLSLLCLLHWQVGSLPLSHLGSPKVRWKCKSCTILCDPMNCNLPGSSSHRVLQARILGWIDFPFFKGTSEPKDQTQVSYFNRPIYSERAMAPHSSTFAWKILWMEEPGRLQSMGSLRVPYNWATSLSLFIFMHWRRKWQPTPVFLPGESQGQGSLVGCRLWGLTESDMTEVT